MEEIQKSRNKTQLNVKEVFQTWKESRNPETRPNLQKLRFHTEKS